MTGCAMKFPRHLQIWEKGSLFRGGSILTDNLREELVQSSVIFQGRIISVSVDTVRLPDGMETTREVVKHHGAVAMVPILPDNCVVLVRQWRHAAGRALLEINCIILLLLSGVYLPYSDIFLYNARSYADLWGCKRFYMQKRAVVLLSGGLDSTTALAIALEDGYTVYALTIAYGQRHLREIEAAKIVAATMGVIEHKCVDITLREIGGSALTADIPVPLERSAKEIGAGIPITYVPARNTIFLSIALGYAEVVGAETIIAGMNQVDYSGYPDCRREYLEAFEGLANLATKAGVERQSHFRVWAPLLSMSKEEIDLLMPARSRRCYAVRVPGSCSRQPLGTRVKCCPTPGFFRLAAAG